MSSDSMDVLKRGRERLKSADIDGYTLDALVLLAFALKKPKEWLFAHDYTLTEAEEHKFFSAIEKRSEGWPVQYIINRCEFMGLDFYVDESVLIPRSDTEIIVEKLLEESENIESPKILDLCTGSGCIAISTAYYNKEAEITAIDISHDAVKTAKKNACTHGVERRIKFLESDLFEIFEKTVQIGRFFDIIVSNPPYISIKEMNTLPREVRREPEAALLAGGTGLEFYEIITEKSQAYIKNGGILIFETGCAQAERVVEIMARNGYNNISIFKDLAGHNRAAAGKYKGEFNV